MTLPQGAFGGPGTPRASILRKPLRPTISTCVLMAAGVFFVLTSAMGGPAEFQSDHRLLPLFLFADGRTVYPDPLTGPIATPLYAPLSFLAYFPALLFRTPGAAIFCAKLLAQLYTVPPILCLLWFRSRRDAAAREGMFILTLVVLMAVLTSDVLSHMTMLHADAPALFLCFCACVLTDRLRRKPSIRFVLATALCCALAPWTKQAAAPIVLAPIVVLLATPRWKVLAGFGAGYAALQALLAGFFFFLFRGQRMFYWLFQATSHQLEGHSFRNIAKDFSLANSLMWVFLAIVLYHVFSRLGPVFRARPAREGHAETSDETGIENIFLLAALVGYPASVLGFMFPGADNNAVLYFVYPAFVFVLLRLQRILLPLNAKPETAAALRRGVAAIAVACLAMSFPLAANVASGWSIRYGPKVDIAYRFMRRHPGQVWFPRYPLTSYLAEGKVYHLDMGFFNRHFMGIPISRSQLVKYIPNEGRLVACAADCDYLYVSLSGYRTIPSPELAGGWTLYERTSENLFDPESEWR